MSLSANTSLREKKYYSTIYTFTTPLKESHGRVKVGSARRKARSAYEAAEIRIAEQSTAISSDDPPRLLEVFDVSDFCETGSAKKSISNLRNIEKDLLHKKMKAAGMWFSGDKGGTIIKDTSEWFYGKTTKEVNDTVKSLLNQMLTGIYRPENYKMRSEQQECHDKAVNHFMKGGKKFLINGKMRVGKTFITYQIVKSLSEKSYSKKPFRVLVVTYKPQVQDGWADDAETHVDFSGFKYYYAKNFDKNNPIILDSDEKVEILFASFQDLNEMKKDKWKFIKNYHFDLVTIDEQHYGSATKKATETLDAISYSRVLELSGTPLHALTSGKFLEHEIFSWTYSDEQRKRWAEKYDNWKTEVYRWLPEMNFMVFKISDEAKAQCRFYTKEEGFTVPKMFASNDGEFFIDESAVTRWTEDVWGLTGHKNKSPIRQYNSNHMVWRLSSVNSCYAMKNLLLRLGYVNHVPIVVSGLQGENLDAVKNHIKKYPKTITITCGSLMTGTTIPEWDMIFMLDSGKSPQDYFQTIFRVQSMNKAAGKEICYVVDYNPQRNLEMIYEYAFIQSTINNKSVQKNISEFLDFAPIMDHTGNKPVRKNIEDVLDAIAHSSTAIENFRSGLNIDISVANEDVKTILMKVSSERSSERKTVVNDNGINLGKNKNITTREKNQESMTKSEISELQRKAITTIKNITNYLWVEEGEIDNINDICKLGNNEVFEEEVGISLNNFEVLCDLGFVNVKRVNQCILAFQQICKGNGILST